MSLFKKIVSFYAISKPDARIEGDQKEVKKRYNRLAMQSFIAATFGYSLYYVCRTTLNVMKKPIIDSGMLDASQLGIIGSALLFAYAIGKLINGFMCDYCNIKRFMATGLILSTIANIVMGIMGVGGTAVFSSFAIFLVFAIMWGINGWSQSMGAPPAIISLSRWFPLSRRGTFYGIFSASHNLGEGFSFLFVGLIVSAFGWQWGFFGSAIAGIIGIILIILCLHDTPESKGLPSIEELSHEAPSKKASETTSEIQRQVIRNPAVWILALASAFMYISRYSLNSWGVLFLQEQKGFSIERATLIISINAFLGIIGTVVAGYISDVLFNGNRKYPALIAGILLSISYALFIYGGNSEWINILSMILFGIAIGVLIAFLGGLMAIDIVPRRATGAALGIVGMASYAAAGLQDVISGFLINSHITESVNSLGETVKHYDFSHAALFWIGASVVSFLLPILNWRHKAEDL